MDKSLLLLTFLFALTFISFSHFLDIWMHCLILHLKWNNIYISDLYFFIQFSLNITVLFCKYEFELLMIYFNKLEINKMQVFFFRFKYS